MQQAKFSVEKSQIDFLSQYKIYGFKDKSTMVRIALERLKRELELESLQQSADLYAEIYEGDSELKELTDIAVAGWPE